ncbi:hypothetical protein HPB48_005047 [Haemaphysalis longicornis]|uniref:histone acetyltransferase n=1 Tax=Haemaphysalis longicornis TaxID=44386 RepID=A0A9J6G4H7_HAELO|nr:hypothetical protein HPB48_005047 [Haemaphysalis longicornis]
MADHLVDGPPNKRQKLAETGLSSDSADFSRLWDLENELPEELMGGPPPLGDLGPPQPGGAQQNGTGGEEVAGQRHQQLSQLLQSKANHGSPKEQLVGGGPKLLGGPLLNGPPMGQPRPPQSLGALLGPNSPHQGGPSGMGAPAMKGPGGAMGQASFHGGYGQVMSMGQLGQPQQRPMGANLGAALGMPPRYSSVDSSQLQNPPPPHPGGGPLGGPPAAAAPSTADPEKRKLIQQQLVLLLHAHKCQRRESQAANGEVRQCSLPHCRTMKNVLNHMTNCQAGKACPVPHCASSRQIISHWKKLYAQRLPRLPAPQAGLGPAAAAGRRRPPAQPAQPGPAPATCSAPTPPWACPTTRLAEARGRGQRPSAEGSSSAGDRRWSARVVPPGGAPGGVSLAQPTGGVAKDWHQSVTRDLRHHLVLKIVQAIFPTPEPATLQDRRMNKLVAYAKMVEGDMYEMANSRVSVPSPPVWVGGRECSAGCRLGAAVNSQMQPGAQSHLTGPLGAPGPQRMAPPNITVPGPFPPNSLGAPPGAPTPGFGSPLQQQQQQAAAPPPSFGNVAGTGNSLAGSLDGGGMGSLNSQFPQSQQFEAMKRHLIQQQAQQLMNQTSQVQLGSATNSTASAQVVYTLAHFPVDSAFMCQQPPRASSVPSSLGGSQPPTPLGSSGGAPAPLPPPSQQLPDQILATEDPEDSSRGPDPDLSLTLSTPEGSAAATPAQGKKSIENLDSSSGGPKSMKDGGKMEVDCKPDLRSIGKGENRLEGPGENGLPSSIGAGEVSTPAAKPDVKLPAPPPPTKTEQPSSTGEASSASASASSPPKPRSNKKVFKPDELRQALMPTLEKLYRQDPHSLPFRQPVDPQLLQIPDYFDIVKNPMDLSTIKRKLDTGQYQDPWQYVDDVWLMFDNAWLYNRKTSRVYRYCTKLSEEFEQEIDPVMQSLGYCCGRKFVYQPQVLCCFGKQLCTIPRDAKYWSYQNRQAPPACFAEIPGDAVTLGDDPTQPQTTIRKDQFIEMKNDHLELEPFVECLDCGRKLHQVCVLHFDAIWPEGFTCDNCLKQKGKKRKENKFTSKRLPTCKLGNFIENRVNCYLKKKESGAGEVTIRVVACTEKLVEVKPGMKSRYVETGHWPEQFPYRAKALFAFEEIDGVDTCFFGMHVQEYGSECHPPNTRRVYIAYLDSVHFFRPKRFRTAVYHEILLGYLDYVKQLGFAMAHIWACPPSEGDDYIFHCHPPEQKIPKPKRLQDWYKMMLDKGILERIVLEYKDILKQATEDNLTSACELPYFEGDFWPNVLEESIKELDQEEEEKRKAAEALAASAAASEGSQDGEPEGTELGEKKGQKSGRNKKANKSKSNQRKNNKKSTVPHSGNDLSAKIYSTMEKHKEVFFVIRLHSAQAAVSLPQIHDPDLLMQCDLMDGRDAFLTLAREKHYEFSSLRRAKYSTMAMLYELHNQGQDRFVYTCNSCKSHVETRYHCTVCDDFDLCVACYDREGHPHKMEKLGFDLDDGSSAADPKQSNPQESQRLSIQRCIHSLVHACQCRDANCRLPSCRRMKRVVQHSKSCKRKTNGGCPICKQLIALCCYHAKHCQEAKCPVPFCLNIKHKLRQQQLQQRLQQAQILQRRIASMATMQNRGAAPALPPASSSGPSGMGGPPALPPAGTPPGGSGAKPTVGTGPPVGALQAAQQVQAAAARQQAPHLGGNPGYGKGRPPRRSPWRPRGPA